MANGRPGRPKGLPKSGGRKPGVPNKVTADIKALAQSHGPYAIEKLVGILDSDAPPAALVAAARELLDRGYGKATQPISGDDSKPPISVLQRTINMSDEDLARIAGMKE